MFKSIRQDIPASIVVFFVALPLCLGIALASGAPLFSGLIAGIVGGIVVGFLSGSSIGVSGPAAGLTAIVLSAIGTLGGWENFLVALVLGGVIQLVFGIIRAGIIGYYFPSSVIRGMLTGIGIIIILKQIPHFFGYDKDPEGDWAFFQVDGANTFSELLNTVNNISPGASLIALIGLGVLLLWDKVLSGKSKVFTVIQGPLVAVVLGILYYLTTQSHPVLSIATEHLVQVPVPENAASFMQQFSFPNFEVITKSEVWVTAFTIALVASLETLLCVEATDKLDPEKRVTPTNRELLAQGAGNILSGMIGGLPVTQVIVPSSANVQSGGRHEMGGNRFVAGRNNHHSIPGNHPAVHLYQITENLPGRQYEVHPVVGHRPAVTDVGAMKIGRFAAVLVYTGGDLLCQRVQVDTAGMAAAEDIFHQNLGIL